MAASRSRDGGHREGAKDHQELGAAPQKKRPSEFGRTLKHLRTEAGLSQAALASRAAVSPGYVGLIETGDRGERPSLDIVRRFGQAVNATVEQTEVLLRSAGHLGPDERLIQEGRPSFAAFVDSDRRLSGSQKELLKGIYASWIGRIQATQEKSDS